jgi:hypothetical protein
MTYTSVTLTVSKYRILDRAVQLSFRTANGTTGGTATASLDVSLPFNLNGSGARLPAYVFDGTGNRIGWGNYDSVNSKIRLYKFEVVNFGLGGNREFAIEHFIRIP